MNAPDDRVWRRRVGEPAAWGPVKVPDRHERVHERVLDNPVPGPQQVLLSIGHGLGTEDVQVRCWTADGKPLGYGFAVPISEHEVEVLVGTGTARVTVTRAPETTDT